MVEFGQALEPESDATVQQIAWVELLRRCIEKFGALRDNINVTPVSFESVGLWQDTELESLFGRYLNTEYRCHLLENAEEALGNAS
jgi:hypothetical protein